MNNFKVIMFKLQWLIPWLVIIPLTAGFSFEKKFYNVMTIVFLFIIQVLFLRQNKNKKLEKISENINHSSNTLEKYGVSLTDSTGSLKNSFEQYFTEVEKTSSSAEEIHKMSILNLDQAKSLKDKVNQCSSSSQKLNDSFNNLSQVVHSASLANEKLNSDVIKGFEDISTAFSAINQIADKINLIDEIVFQTKLLSFNASVEAARAGEYGKGFSVVAEEIGSLAKSSGNAAKEINSIVESNIKVINKTIKESKVLIEESIKNSSQAANESERLSRESVKSLTSMVNTFEDLLRAGNEVEKASDEQKIGAEYINKSLHKIFEISVEIKNAIKETNDFSQGVKSGVEELCKITSDLTEVALGLAIQDKNVREVEQIKDSYILIDVRRPDEWFSKETGVVDGANLWTLGEELEQNLNSLDRKGKYIFICRSGGRSAKAARLAQRLGFKNILNMSGGMLEWNKQNLPVKHLSEHVHFFGRFPKQASIFLS